MPYPALNSIYDTQCLLNDSRGNTYTFEKVLPYLRRAYNDLQEILQLAECAVMVELTGGMTVTAGGVVLDPQPDNIVLPLFMEERGVGEVDYIPMQQTRWEPNDQPGSVLQYWTWREETIVFLGATVDRQVRLLYLKGFDELVDQKSQIVASNAKNFISAKTAEYIERYVKQNYRKADSLAIDAQTSIDRVTRIATKGEQAMPVRRLPYGTSRRLSRLFRRG